MLWQLKLAAGGAAVLALTFTLVFGRSSPPAPDMAANPEPVESSFDSAWNDTAVPLALAKSSSLASTEPKPVKLEKIALDPPPPPKPVASRPKPKAEAEPEPEKRDTCSRHGMQKVVYRGGRSWRCVKARQEVRRYKRTEKKSSVFGFVDASKNGS